MRLELNEQGQITVDPYWSDNPKQLIEWAKKRKHVTITLEPRAFYDSERDYFVTIGDDSESPDQ